MPGARVLVPFGRRQLTGVVAERVEGSAEGLKPLHDVLDARPALTPELLGLTQWMADYYLCAWGEAVKAALPSGTGVESRRVAHALAPADAWTDDPRGRKILRALAEQQRGRPARRRGGRRAGTQDGPPEPAAADGGGRRAPRRRTRSRTPP